MVSNFIEGQRALDRLLDDVKSKSVSHAYILEGPRGVGKKTAAEIFAEALHCTGDVKPCGSCPGCVMHRAGTHPDVMRIEPEDSGVIKIDAVRAAAEELFMRPKLSERKILIVRGADGMNPAAQNALLKLFEEPPVYGVIVLLSESIQNILPTIRSRGVKLLFEPFPREKIRAFVLREYPAFAGRSDFVADYSAGIVGRARDICEDEDFFALRAELFTALASLSGSKRSVFDAASAFGCGSGKKVDAARRSACFDLMLSFFGDVVALKTGARPVNVDFRKELDTIAAATGISGALSAVETVAKTAAELNNTMKYDLWITDMFIKCWGDIHGNSNRS